jgi:2',3'-cyclic-nucleotide 2'-phosphodiesterase (5'-nucleotidase family)
VAELRFGDLTAAVRHVLPAARAAADFVIVVAHAGDVELFDLARGLDSGAVDLILAGHTHQLVDTVVHGILVVQPGSAGQAIAVVDIIRRAGGLGRQIRARLETPWTDAVVPDRGLATDLARVQRAADSITAQPVTTLRLNLRRDGDEHPLGRLIVDAFRNMGRADAAVINSSGIRADLQSGVVTYGALNEALPFRNRIMRLTITGAVLREVLEHAVAGGSPDIHVAGLQVWYDPGRPVGQRIQRVRLATGANLDPSLAYTLAVSDFLADGGAGYAMLAGLPRIDTGLVDLDAVIAYLSVLRKPVDAPADQRFHGGSR